MAASISTVQEEDGVLIRAVVIRTVHEVKDSTTQYEDHCKLVNALGTALNAPENKSVFSILAMMERRLDAALVSGTNAIASFTNFCVAEKSVLHAQSAAATVAMAPLSDAVATTSTTVPSTSNNISDKKMIKKKLPEMRDGWKDYSGKTHCVHYEHCNKMVTYTIA
jgi:hypothetical protein